MQGGREHGRGASGRRGTDKAKPFLSAKKSQSHSGHGHDQHKQQSILATARSLRPTTDLSAFSANSQSTQSISSVFYLPQQPASPANATVARATSMESSTSTTSSVGSATLVSSSQQPSSVTQMLTNLKKKARAGNLQGVRLQHVDLVTPRLVARCSPYLRDLTFDGKPLTADLADLARNVEEEYAVRVLISFNKPNGEVHVATVPVADSKDTRFLRAIEGVRNSISKFKPRISQPIENVLKLVVSNLNAAARDCIVDAADALAGREGAPVNDAEAVPPPGSTQSNTRPSSSLLFQMDISETQSRNRIAARPRGGAAGRRANSSSSIPSVSSGIAPAPRNKTPVGGLRSNASDGGLTQRTVSTDSGGAEPRSQPCPRFAGASFSGPGLLVAFSSGVTERLRQLSHISRPRRVRLSPPGKAPVPTADAERPVPRTYEELMYRLRIDEAPSTLRPIGSDRHLRHPGGSANSLLDDVPSLLFSGKADFPEELSADEAHAMSARFAKYESVQDSLSMPTAVNGGVPGTSSPRGPPNPGSASSDGVTVTPTSEDVIHAHDARAQMLRRVVILDSSLLSPIQRFLGRALRIGALDSLQKGARAGPAVLLPGAKPHMRAFGEPVAATGPLALTNLSERAGKLRHRGSSSSRWSADIPFKERKDSTIVQMHDDGPLGPAKSAKTAGEEEREARQHEKDFQHLQGPHDIAAHVESEDEVDMDEEDEDEELTSLESLLCWWDDFSDESVHVWDHLPLHVANMLASQSVGRFDLVQTWHTLRLICHPDIAAYESNLTKVMAPGPRSAERAARWAMHPCGRRLVQRIFQDLAHFKDVQSLAILSCVLQEESNSEDWKNTMSLLDPAHREEHDRFRRAYANILHRWGLNTKRAEVMKYVKPDSLQTETNHVSIAPSCAHCGSMHGIDGDVNRLRCAKGRRLQCVICSCSVRGLCTFCPLCGHGGHAEHMNAWFLAANECPTGCGCTCGDHIK
ncbi:Restriction of telomere capping protein 1 [Hondaea fermentalgiana]|uniref:Restriction of telomere capping protein 1 n=1 Tax=Hondaea fermentalgiana TaxID=2315210 RepID=A0A2R5GAW0_9STRA|nr:Restriction of telomere capping protein 1 [Hondaea fermentalgiana]|eukprot:GBG28147.1 Restriction of telomere capping protein 1 [Hondaea fermentalgiana]